MKCALCGGKKIKIESLCSNMKIMGPQFPETGVDVSYCQSCGLVQYDTDAIWEDFMNYYVSPVCTPFHYEKNYGKKKTEEYFSHIYSKIKDFINEDSQILDIGGAWGEFSDFLYRKGYKNVYVVDPSPKCISHIKKRGGQFVEADSINMIGKLEEKQYDLVLLVHTMEHLIELEQTLTNIKKILKPTGYIYIEVPDVEGYSIEKLAPYYFLTYEHLLHFGMNDLINLANKYSFHILKKEKYMKLEHYPSIFMCCSLSDVNRPLIYSKKGEETIKEYMIQSQLCLENLNKEYEITQEELILWGIGASTTQLLKGFNKCNVIQLIDENPLRQKIEFKISGKKLKIQSPEYISSKGKIIILPYMYANAIKEQISRMGIKNEVRTLL